MPWSDLATQFSLELAFGVCLGLCLLGRAPLGLFFHRMMGTVVLLPLALAIALPLYSGAAHWKDPAILSTAAAALSYPLVSGPVRAALRLRAQLWTLAWTAAALGFSVSSLPGLEGSASVLLCTASALATGSVAGGVGLAMVVGHWYLTVPDLPIQWLQKLNRFTVYAMLASLLLLGLTCLFFRAELADGRSPLLGPWGALQLGARIATGLALPLLFAWMTAGSLAWRNTRSATGILYASTVLVLIGTAVSVSLQSTYGIPL